jgi:hypothetical protein
VKDVWRTNRSAPFLATYGEGDYLGASVIVGYHNESFKTRGSMSAFPSALLSQSCADHHDICCLYLPPSQRCGFSRAMYFATVYGTSWIYHLSLLSLCSAPRESRSKRNIVRLSLCTRVYSCYPSDRSSSTGPGYSTLHTHRYYSPLVMELSIKFKVGSIGFQS